MARTAGSDRASFARVWWYSFRRNPLSILGLALVLIIAASAVLATVVAPYPGHAGRYVSFSEAHMPPSWRHLFGTDGFGRDILTRVLFGFRLSLTMAAVVLSLSAPIGVALGLIAGYFNGTLVDTVITRITDVFLAVPPLILALAICSVLKPDILHAMLAVSLVWWPWYVRLVYGVSSSVRNETFVVAAETLGLKRRTIILREVFPNCLSPVVTKITLDIGFVILVGASLSFVGLGAQAPTADLGSMVADGARYLPDQWWESVFPAIAIVVIVLGFNLLGDGLRDAFTGLE